MCHYLTGSRKDAIGVEFRESPIVKFKYHFFLLGNALGFGDLNDLPLMVVLALME